MKLLLKNIKIISILILAISFLGCEDDDTLLPEVISSFSFTLNEDTGTVTFLNISEKARTYLWDFGDGTSSTEINPIKTYTSGTYTIVLTASNTAGASSTFEDELTVTIPDPPTPLTLPIDFDGTDVDYDIIVGDNIGFTVETNPENGNGNDTNVGQMVTGGGQFQNVQFPLGPAVDFSGANKTIQLELFASTEIAVLIKFEDGADGARDAEVGATHTGSGWDTLSFDFAADAVASFIEGDSQNGQPIVPDGQYGKLILFIGFNTNPGVEGTFFVDNIEQVGAGIGNGTCTAETEESISATDLNITWQTNTPAVTEDNVTFAWVDNPDFDGPVNTSCKVGQVTRANNSPFDNLQIDLADKFDFNAVEGLRMKVWSPVPNTPVLLKLEEIGNSGNFVEVTATTSVTSDWEELTFDFPSTPTPQFDKMVIFFNFNVADGSTYYFDDLMVYGTPSGGACVPETGESTAAADLNITWQTNTPAVIEDNASFTWIDNPDFDGPVNTSCKVGQVVRANNSPFDNIQIDLAAKLDFNAVEGLRMKVWSPVPNTPVLLKLEEIGNSGNFAEVLATTSVTNGWEELTFDFDATSTPQFDKMVIFFNFNVADGSTYYFDDLMVYGTPVSGPTPLSSLPADFEGGEEFGGVFEPASVNGSITSNTVSGGINTSANVYTFNKPSGTEFYGGMENVFATPLDMTTTRTFKVKVYSTKANVVFQFELQSRPNPGSIPNYSLQQTVTNANEWVELTFDFGAVVPVDFNPNIYNSIVIIPDFDTGNQPTSSSETYYIDDVILE